MTGPIERIIVSCPHCHEALTVEDCFPLGYHMPRISACRSEDKCRCFHCSKPFTLTEFRAYQATTPGSDS